MFNYIFKAFKNLIVIFLNAFFIKGDYNEQYNNSRTI